MLEQRRCRQLASRARPACRRLVVVPKSLVFNWIDEAQRFTPQLRVYNYTGLQRAALREELDQADLIVTTYGTLRRDIVELKERAFDYVILDEAQAIKNSASQMAKASLLLQARQRLALSGTPIENHLGELWSLFEFLNPGMLGRSIGVRGAVQGHQGRRSASRCANWPAPWHRSSSAAPRNRS